MASDYAKRVASGLSWCDLCRQVPSDPSDIEFEVDVDAVAELIDRVHEDGRQLGLDQAIAAVAGTEQQVADLIDRVRLGGRL